MGRDELTDGGAPVARPSPRRDAPSRYGDRFRPTAAPPGPDPAGRAAGEDAVDVVAAAPVRPWRALPLWLTRGAAGLGVVTAAVVAVATGGLDDSTSQAAPDAPPHLAAALDDPSVASLYASRVEGEFWDHGRFSYQVDPSEPGSTNSCTYLGGTPRFGSVYWC